jgi:hypothetical protein
MQYISAVPTFFTASFVACILNAQFRFIYSFNITCLSRKQSNLPYLNVPLYGATWRRVCWCTVSVPTGRGLSPNTSAFPCQFHSTGAPLHGKTKKLIIFTTGLHGKPEGCGASVAPSARLFTTLPAFSLCLYQCGCVTSVLPLSRR